MVFGATLQQVLENRNISSSTSCTMKHGHILKGIRTHVPWLQSQPMNQQRIVVCFKFQIRLEQTFANEVIVSSV